MPASDKQLKNREQTGLEPRPCPVCSTVFAPYRDYQRACSRKCRDALPPIGADNEHAVLTDYQCRRCGKPCQSWTTKGAGKFVSCDECAAVLAEQRAQRKNNVRRSRWSADSEYRERQKQIARRSRYGITPERYAEMLKQQNGVCAICASSPRPGGVRSASRLHVDHDHETGVVRRLLCNSCNQGLGYFGDNIETLTLALEYLKVWKGSTP